MLFAIYIVESDFWTGTFVPLAPFHGHRLLCLFIINYLYTFFIGI